MASFSNLSKTYAKDKLFKCATMILLVCCYLYRKRSNAINVNAEAKEQGRDMQTPVDDSDIFTEVSRSAQASPSPRWSPSQGIPCMGQASDRVTPWIAPGLPHAQADLRLSHSWQSLTRTALRRLHYQASGRNTVGLIPSGIWWRPHHK